MDLEGLRYLVAIADAGSIQAAASSLSAARATVRRRLLEAEAEVGAPLFRRTTKGLVPTPAGAVIVGGGRKMVAEAGILVRAASTLDSEPNGPLRVIVPPGFHPGLINEIVRALRASFSKLTIDFRIEDRPLASLQDTVDLAIIVGDFPVPDTWTVVGKTPIPQRLLASREYLDSHSPVEQPADLAQHVLFAYQPGQAEPIEHLPLLAGGEVPIRPAATFERHPDVALHGRVRHRHRLGAGRTSTACLGAARPDRSSAGRRHRPHPDGSPALAEGPGERRPRQPYAPVHRGRHGADLSVDTCALRVGNMSVLPATPGRAGSGRQGSRCGCQGG